MLYVHSFSPIEQTLCKKLSDAENVVELDSKLILQTEFLTVQDDSSTNKILLYSFQQLEYYKHLNTFQDECQWVDKLIEYATEHHFEKVIVLTYPGVYFNSTNLFLQHKGYIEQRFVASGIPCTFLAIQGIGDSFLNQNNLHSLFYDKIENRYLIPKKTRSFVYSITLNNLVSLILKGMHTSVEGKHDAFDTIFEIKTFLLHYSRIENVTRMAPLYLYFKSYCGTYLSPSMLELFLLATVPMYTFRTEKEFGISLLSEIQPQVLSVRRNEISFPRQYNPFLKSLITVE